MLFPTQLKTISAQYKVMCCCKCCTPAKSIYLPLISWSDWYLKNLKIKVSMLKIEGLMKKKNTYMKHIKCSDVTWTSYLC